MKKPTYILIVLLFIHLVSFADKIQIINLVPDELGVKVIGQNSIIQGQVIYYLNRVHPNFPKLNQQLIDAHKAKLPTELNFKKGEFNSIEKVSLGN